MKLFPSEVELVGTWVVAKGQVRCDAICDRILWLTQNHLCKIAASKQWGDWEMLFQDPDDGRFWERTFPQSEMQGGGPPRLTVLTPEEAHAKYQFS
jgi:hypothetical protein